MAFALCHSAAVLIEEKRLQAERERMVKLRAARESAERSGKRLTAVARRAMQPKTAWVDDVREAIVKNGQRLFYLGDIDHRVLRLRHPENWSIDSSVRASLQKLRDMNEVTFVGNGAYIFLAFETDEPVRSARNSSR